MGITGLLPFLDSSSKKVNISEFRGCTVAIDSYCWLHKGAFSCAEKLARGEPTNAYILYCLKYIQLLKSYNIKPILVFDGQHLPAKKDTETKRREQRKFARTKATELLRLGKVDQARQYFRQCVDITHEMALGLIKECRNMNVDCIVAPYEADSQLAYLSIKGIVDIVITEDSDLVMFGCLKIIFKFNLDGSGVLVEKNNLDKSMRMRPEHYSFEKVRYMCIMSGCDYLDSLIGIGLVRAHKAISMTHDSNIYNLLPRLPRYLNLSKLVVTTDYIENFKLADATIKHQIVYDPIRRELRPLTNPAEDNTDPKYLKNAGEICDNDKAFQMALGNIDPISKRVLDDWNPDNETLPTSSIWSTDFKKKKFVPRSANIPIPNANTTRGLEIAANSVGLAEQRNRAAYAYDQQVREQIEMYRGIEPVGKRTRTQEIETRKVTKTAVRNNNPFLKKRPHCSKFQGTTANNTEQMTSAFFNTTPENIPEIAKLVEQMDTENTPNNGTDSNVNISETEVNSQNTDVSDECSVVQSALNRISVGDGDNSIDQDDMDDQGTSSPILSGSHSLRTFKSNRIKKDFSHNSSEATLIERICLTDDLESSTQSSMKESDGDVSVETDVTLIDSSTEEEGFLNNTQFIQKKSTTQCRKVGLSRTVKKSNQPTILTMFEKLPKKQL